MGSSGLSEAVWVVSWGAEWSLGRVDHWLSTLVFGLVSGGCRGASGPLGGVDHWRGFLVFGLVSEVPGSQWSTRQWTTGAAPEFWPGLGISCELARSLHDGVDHWPETF